MKNFKIAITSDHAGFELKSELIKYLIKKGYFVRDLGTDSTKSVDYPDFAHKIADIISNKECHFGISLCGSGNGISMTANKHQNIRSALCWNKEISRLARAHNNANICALPARFINLETAQLIVSTFLNTNFEGGRHLRRIKKIPISQ